MSGAWGKGFWHDDSGATAALYALALPALVAVAGIGFDYAHLAAMDTELQNAADQAALAGATQLDRQADAIERATSAAEGGLVANETLFANDGQGSDIDDLTIQFYAARSDAEACNGNFLDPDDEDSDTVAAYVCVSVDTRAANYALTPVVGVIGGSLAAQASAGVGSALCRTPPLMICNPAEPTGNTDPNRDFDANAYQGRGLLAKGGGGSSWAPGNFGYLDTVPGSGGGTPDLLKALGWTSPPGNCVSQDGNVTVDMETGNHASVADAINTRFDIYNGNLNSMCPAGGSCPASINSMKDVMHPADFTDAQACSLHGDGWQEASAGTYLPAANAADPGSFTAMGHPRDICHATATNTCSGAGPFGDGFWDRDAYFRTHYVRTTVGDGGEAIGSFWTAADWVANTGLSLGSGARPATPTRYQVYLWEIANYGDTVDGVVVLGAKTQGALTAYGQPQCGNRGGRSFGTGTVPSSTIADRRRVSVAIVNCVAHGVRGNSTGVPVQRWMDVFLVQPSLDRTGGRTRKDEIYVEVIGETTAGSAGETAGSVIRRDVPYLLR